MVTVREVKLVDSSKGFFWENVDFVDQRFIMWCKFHYGGKFGWELEHYEEGSDVAWLRIGIAEEGQKSFDFQGEFERNRDYALEKLSEKNPDFCISALAEGWVNWDDMRGGEGWLGCFNAKMEEDSKREEEKKTRWRIENTIETTAYRLGVFIDNLDKLKKRKGESDNARGWWEREPTKYDWICCMDDSEIELLKKVARKFGKIKQEYLRVCQTCRKYYHVADKIGEKYCSTKCQQKDSQLDRKPERIDFNKVLEDLI